VKTRNRFMKSLALASAALMMLALLSTLGASRTKTATKAALPRQCPSCFVSTGMFEVSNEEMVKAWVVNTGASRGLIVDWKVLDAMGNTLAESAAQKVAPNWASSFEFLPIVAAGQRTPLRVELTVDIMREDLRGTRGEHLFIPTLAVSDRATGKKGFGEDFFAIPD